MTNVTTLTAAGLDALLTEIQDLRHQLAEAKNRAAKAEQAVFAQAGREGVMKTVQYERELALQQRDQAWEDRDEALATCNAAIERVELLEKALIPLLAIADAYDANNLDDEARKFWGPSLEHKNENDATPWKIELYAGRGGKRLLTLDDCLHARRLVRKTP